jgi:hypothetical protein
MILHYSLITTTVQLTESLLLHFFIKDSTATDAVWWDDVCGLQQQQHDEMMDHNNIIITKNNIN